ncbi:MAG: hypothetical protein Q8929_01175 [Bacillota bacterium]|nr:hypothetical protein [Bacillota bacterium]
MKQILRKTTNKPDRSIVPLITDYRLLITAMLLPAALLSGCMGIYEGGFECPAGTGVGCKSISDVNALVNLGEIPKTSPEQPIIFKPEIWYVPSTRNMKLTDPKTTGCPSAIEAKNLKENKVEDAAQSI